jgi:hydrogenase nickel incorporation protein HypA/HybF
MSIALSIIDLASDQAAKAQARKIVEIELDIGTLSGVEMEALNFAMEIAKMESVLESAKIRINKIEAIGECLECEHVFDAEGFINHCPRCGEMNTKIIRGKELQLKSILVE